MIKAVKELFGLIVKMSVIVAEEIERVNKILEAENALAQLSNYDFVSVFRPVAKELSQITAITYIEFLNDAAKKFRQGEDVATVLWHYDRLLYERKRGAE